jgi:hypothetical protein
MSALQHAHQSDGDDVAAKEKWCLADAFMMNVFVDTALDSVHGNDADIEELYGMYRKAAAAKVRVQHPINAAALNTRSRDDIFLFVKRTRSHWVSTIQKETPPVLVHFRKSIQKSHQVRSGHATTCLRDLDQFLAMTTCVRHFGNLAWSGDSVMAAQQCLLNDTTSGRSANDPDVRRELCASKSLEALKTYVDDAGMFFVNAAASSAIRTANNNDADEKYSFPLWQFLMYVLTRAALNVSPGLDGDVDSSFVMAAMFCRENRDGTQRPPPPLLLDYLLNDVVPCGSAFAVGKYACWIAPIWKSVMDMCSLPPAVTEDRANFLKTHVAEDHDTVDVCMDEHRVLVPLAGDDATFL